MPPTRRIYLKSNVGAVKSPLPRPWERARGRVFSRVGAPHPKTLSPTLSHWRGKGVEKFEKYD